MNEEEIENENAWKKMIQALEEKGGWIADEDDLDEDVVQEDGMGEMLGAGDDRGKKNDMHESDKDDMVEIDDDAEVGVMEGMNEMMGTQDDRDEKSDMAGDDDDAELGMREGMAEMMGAGDDRDKDDMAEIDDDAELGMREGMTEMMGTGDDKDKKMDMAELDSELDMRDGMNKENEAVGNETGASVGGEREDD
jgi:hypothetical protein